jgi:hypothetical protein
MGKSDIRDIVETTDLQTLENKMYEEIPHSCFCAGVVVKGSKVLVVKYRPYKNNKKNIQIKFIGGTSQESDKTPMDVLKRELNEELFHNSGKIISCKPFLERKYVGNSKKPTHSQIFSLIEIEGKLREKVLYEDKKVDSDGRIFDEEIGIPMFVDVADLTNSKMGIFFRHRPALIRLCEMLAPENVEFMWAHLNLCNSADEYDTK